MIVPTYPLKRKWDILDENSCTIHNHAHNSKLGTDLQERHPFWLGLVQFWCKIVNKSGSEERKDEANDTNPRDAQCPKYGIIQITTIKEKSP
jgi:hypothetical protein